MNMPGHETLIRLHRFHARLRRELDEELGAQHGIDFEDFALLSALATEGERNLSALGDSLGVGRAAVLRRTRPLEKIGLVSAEGTLAQRRLSLAPGGRRVLASAEDTVAEVWRDGIAHLRGEQVDALTAFLPAPGA